MPDITLSRRSFTLGAGSAALASIVAATPGATRQATPPDPMRAAEELSQLEVTEHIPALYTFYELTHPDAQEIIPRHVVIGWFREEFQARDPKPAVATGVEYVDWTWAVNGKTYPDTAVVSFTQEFADGEIVEDVVRLVLHDGEWRWFFGRDRVWVDDQIDRFTQTRNVEYSGTAPYNLASVSLADGMLNRLPDVIELPNTTMQLAEMAAVSPMIPEWATGTDVRQYRDTREPYPLGYAQVFTIQPDLTPAEAIRAAVESYETMPPFTLQAWDLDPGTATPYAQFETFGSDAVGMAQNVMWADADGTMVAIISCVDEAGLEAMAEALIQG